MKRNTPDHPKTRRLARRLGVEWPHAVGLLELLWHFTAEFSKAGDVGRHQDADIEDACGWKGEPGRLVEAFVAEGWLDESPTCRLMIHDWQEHADRAVHMALGRACARFADGTRPKLNGLTDRERKKAEAAYEAADKAAAVLPHKPPACARREDAVRPAPPEPEPRQSPAPPEPEPGEGGAAPPPEAAARSRSPANPLVDRRRLIRQGHEAIPVIAEAEGLDAAEVLARASTGDGRWEGSRKVRLEPMSDDRLALTVTDLLAWRRRVEAARDRAAREAADAAPLPPCNPDAVAAWQRVLEALEAKLNSHAYATWFRPTDGVAIDGDSLCVRVPNGHFVAWIAANFREQVEEAMTAAGLGQRRLELVPVRADP